MNSIHTKQFIQILLFLSMLAGGMGCKNKNSDDTNPITTVTTGRFALHLHAQVGESEVETYDSVYTDSEGRKLKLNLAQFYLSEIQLVRLDGSIYEVPAARILKTLDEDIFEIGDVPAGNYKTVKFKVGLASAVNLLMPNASKDSLILNHPEMWFGNSAQPDGYVFMHVMGSIDTTAQKTGNGLIPFDIKMGTNAHYVEVTMPVKNFSVVPGSVTYVHLLTDYGKLFSGISLTDINNLTLTTAAANASALATQIANNIPSMFDYEE